MSVSAIGGVSVAAAVCSETMRPSTGFSVLPGAAKAESAGGVSGISVDCLLLLQEVDPPEQRNRRARRHAESMLEQLAALQRALLRGEPDAAALAGLAALAQSVPAAVDPGMRDAVAGVTVRAFVELARHGALGA